MDAIAEAWLARPWPVPRLRAYSVLVGTDGDSMLHYLQWVAAECFVTVSVEFDAPDPHRQREWVDGVFAAGGDSPPPGSGLIAAHFHLSTWPAPGPVSLDHSPYQR